MKAACLVLVSTCFGACLDPDISGTRDAVVIAASTGGAAYELETRSVTADDFTTLAGESVRLINRPDLTFELNGATASVEVSNESPMHVTYAEDGNTLVATDYLGLVAITTYHHMDESHAYFRNLGLGSATADLPQQRVMFLPSISVAGMPGPVVLNDNMAYVFQIDSFIVFSEEQLDEIPLAANHGVVNHEFSHSVLDFLTQDASGQPAEIRYDWDSTSTNFWVSLHEGLADVHAVGITNDPNFIAASGRDLLVGRDVSEEHVASSGLLQDTQSSVESYDPYPLGSVLAATFWTYSEELRSGGTEEAEARLQMARLAFNAVSTLSLSSGGFHISDFLKAVTDSTADEDWCVAVREHFALLQTEAGCL
jgi:hypothetical protein